MNLQHEERALSETQANHQIDLVNKIGSLAADKLTVAAQLVISVWASLKFDDEGAFYTHRNWNCARVIASMQEY